MVQVIVETGMALVEQGSLDDSHFQLPIHRLPTRPSVIDEETKEQQNDQFEESCFHTTDDSSVGSGQDIPTPAELMEDAQTNGQKKEIPKLPQRPTERDYDEFHYSILRGDVETINAILDLGVDIEREADEGYTPLVISIVAVQVDVTRILLERGADVHRRVRTLPPIVYAVRGVDRAPQLLQLLLDHGANPRTISGAEQLNALHWAALDGMVDAVDFLISRGMDLNSTCSEGRTPLILASEQGHTVIVKVLLAKGAELYRRSNNGATALTWAACNGHLDTVQYLLDQGIDVDDCDNCGLTALLAASNLGQLDIVEFLINKGADVNKLSIEPKNFTPAMAASTAGHTEVLQTLIDHGADLKITNGRGNTILEATMASGHMEAVKALLLIIGGPGYPQDSMALQIAMADSHAALQSLIATASMMFPHIKTADNSSRFAWMEWVLTNGGGLVKSRAMSALLHGALYDQHFDMVEALLGHGCDPNQYLVSGNTPLSIAIRHRKIDLIRILLEAGADPAKRGRDPEGCNLSPLHQAITALEDDSEKDTSIVDMLLETGRCKVMEGERPRSTAFSHVLRQSSHGSNHFARTLVRKILDSIPDVNSERCGDGSTLMHVAVKDKRPDVIDILVQRGADINATDRLGQTPSHISCKGDETFLPFLILRGADPFAKNKQGHSGLHVAATYGKISNLISLLAIGLDIEDTNSLGETPLLLALEAGQEDAALYLLSQGANPLAKCLTASPNILHYATMLCMERVVDMMLENGGVDVNARDREGSTPLALACVTGSTNLITALLEAGANPEVPKNTGDRPLHIALAAGNEDVALLLITHGADISARGSHNRTPLHLAAEHSSRRAALLLLLKGASTEALDSATRTPLCVCTDARIAQGLISHGANTHHVDTNAWTPLHHAVRTSSIATFRLLIQAGADPTATSISPSSSSSSSSSSALSVRAQIEGIADEFLREQFADALEEEVGIRKRLELRMEKEKLYGLI